MHFGKQLKLLVYAPWKSFYIDFQGLKRTLKDLVEVATTENRVVFLTNEQAHERQEKENVVVTYEQAIRVRSSLDIERGSSSTIGPDDFSVVSMPRSDGDAKSQKGDEKRSENEGELEAFVNLTKDLENIFMAHLWRELEKVNSFFQSELQKCKTKLKSIETSTKRKKANGAQITSVKKDFFDILLAVEELQDFARLNLVGFTKIVKKFSRRTDFAGKQETMEKINASPFVALLPDCEDLESHVKDVYARLFSDNEEAPDPKTAHELVQSVTAARSWKMNTILFQVDEHMRKATVRAKKHETKPIPVIIALVILAALLFAPIFSESDSPAQRCLAILLAGTVLWVTECWPLFVTSVLIIILVPISSVLIDPATNLPYNAIDATKVVFTKLFPTSVPLILAGFSISAAFKKYHIDIAIANAILGRKFFHSPRRFVIAVELLVFFMSMWVSNVAASVLTLTVIMPVIRDLPERCRYINTLLMACAVAGNVGGMTTQIASPQNAVTVSLGENSIDFITFIGASFPIWPLLLIIGHFVVMGFYKPDVTELPDMDAHHKAIVEASLSSSSAAAATLEAARERTLTEDEKKSCMQRVSWKVAATLTITLLSVVLWIASNWLSFLGCSIGLISFIPILLFYGVGLLGKEDFEALPWSLFMLLAGGNVLGFAVESSHLLEMVAGLLTKLPNNTFVLMLVANLIMMIAGSFVSHTVAALILLALCAKVGAAVGHAKLMIMCAVIMCSGAMPLPMSSFPNLNSMSLEDADGKPYLTTKDFLRIGTIQTLVAFVLSCSVTYGMCLLLKL